MLYQAPTGKVHSSLVDHDLCVFIRNNAKTDYAALSELPVGGYEPGDDCLNCQSAIAEELKSAPDLEGSNQADSGEMLFGQGGDESDVDDWEDEDEFVVDPEKKAAAEVDLGIRDAEQALYNWEYIVDQARSDQGREFWRKKIQDLRDAIEFRPEAENPTGGQEEISAQEAVEDERVAPKGTASRRKPVKKAATSAA
ncbi:hypothetical protein [Streptomyces sp. NPDC050485]|uniref:hypothetical protein n=1 Tax=Streptomyces sp. NPDC050485 TaxID=3365617 RepID=UPI0037AE4E47